MPSPRRAATGRSTPPQRPSGTMIKLQILGAVIGPMLLVGIWLHHQGFW